MMQVLGMQILPMLRQIAGLPADLIDQDQRSDGLGDLLHSSGLFGPVALGIFSGDAR